MRIFGVYSGLGRPPAQRQLARHVAGFFPGSSLLGPGSLTHLRQIKFLLTLLRALHFVKTLILHLFAPEIRKGGRWQQRERTNAHDTALISLSRRHYINHRKALSVQAGRILYRSLFQSNSVPVILFYPDHCAALCSSSGGEVAATTPLC